MNRKLLSALLFTATTAAVADSVIIQETKTWKSVPVTIDQTAHTYTTVEGPVPTGDYYYSYPGYRCITVKKTLAGEVVYHNASGNSIYCYPE